jgi:hypothetical protein
VIKPGQKIHASVAFIQNYQPRARFSDDVEGGDWLRVLTAGRQDRFEWTKITDFLELDLFDYSRAELLINNLRRSKDVDQSMRTLGFWAETRMILLISQVALISLLSLQVEGLQAIAHATLDFSLFATMVKENGDEKIKKILSYLVGHGGISLRVLPNVADAGWKQ